MNNNEIKIALVGDSFIQNVYIDNSETLTFQKFCFENAKFRDFTYSWSYANLQAYHPDLIFLHIGGDDIMKKRKHLEISQNIISIANSFTINGVPVFVAQIKSRVNTKNVDCKRKRLRINNTLKKTFGASYFKFPINFINNPLDTKTIFERYSRDILFKTKNWQRRSK